MPFLLTRAAAAAVCAASSRRAALLTLAPPTTTAAPRVAAGAFGARGGGVRARASASDDAERAARDAERMGGHMKDAVRCVFGGEGVESGWRRERAVMSSEARR